MSAFDLQPDNNDRRAWADANAISPDQIEPSFWQGAWKPVALAVPKVAASATKIAGLAYAAPLALIDEGFGTSYADPIFQAIDKYPTNWVHQLTPDPRTLGTAGKVLGGVSEGLLELVAGGGNPTVMMAMQGNEGAQNVIEQGGSVNAAYGIGALNAATAGLGAKLPYLGTTLTSRVISGTAGNVALGSASRGMTGAILRADGQKSQADQYNAFGATDMLTDTVLGVAFGTVAHALTRKVLPSHVDAALTIKNAQHFQEGTAPGVPLDIEASVKHQDALETALHQLDEGAPIEVRDTGVQHANFAPRDLPNTIEVPKELRAEVPQESSRNLPPELASIPSDTTLSAGDRVIESNFREQIQRDPQAAMDAYAKLPDSSGGKVLNTDIARELSTDYLKDRTKSAAVHEPASAMVKAMYAAKLAEAPKAGEEPLVVFSAGGTGAGKTTGLELTGLGEKAQIVYDSNMNSLESSSKRIDQALAAGKQVYIQYTYRDPVEALTHGALPRAVRQEKQFGSGRTVPLAEHAKTHIGASEVVRQLAEKYANDPRVNITVVDNSHGKGKAVVSDLSVVPHVEKAHTDLVGKLHEALDQQHQAGQISDAIYKGFKGGSAATNSAIQSEGIRPEDGGSGSQETQRSINAERVTPELAASRELVQQNPDAKVSVGFDEDGNPAKISAAEALQHIEAEQAKSIRESQAYQAAVNCFLRRG